MWERKPFSDNDGSDQSALKITKSVAGDYVDKNNDYTFTLRFTNAAPNTVKVSDGTKEYDYGTDYTFTLKDGAEKTFTVVPAGTTYTLSEADFTNKKTTEYAVVSNGKTVSSTAAPSGTLVGEKANTVTVTNTMKDVTITGVMTSIAPFLALIAAAAAVAIVYLSVRRKLHRG